MSLKLYLLVYVLLINFIAFITMLYDKKMAIKGNYRVSEKTLFLIALFGGGIGIFLGMYCFRHKTKHLKFQVGIPMLIIINLVTIAYLLQKLN